MEAMDPSNFMSLTAAHRGDDVHGARARPGRANACGAPPAPRELISRPCQGDPTIAALMTLVSAQRDELEGTALGFTAEEVDELTDRLDERAREVRRLTAQLDSAGSELQLLRDRTNRLAAALGACASCWGEDPGCRECHGHGRPGRSMPDEGLFTEVVMPAVLLMRPHDHRSCLTTSEPTATGSASENVIVNLYAKALLNRGTHKR